MPRTKVSISKKVRILKQAKDISLVLTSSLIVSFFAIEYAILLSEKFSIIKKLRFYDISVYKCILTVFCIELEHSKKRTCIIIIICNVCNV